MSSADPAPYRLTPRAQADLEDIWRHTAETWSVGQGDRHIRGLVQSSAVIVAMPTMARERREFDPPVRIQVHDRHLLVYVLEGDGVTILRVLGGRQDWVSILNAAEP